MIKYEYKMLTNGLKVYVLPANKGSGVVSINVFYDFGSSDEYMGKSGIAHMLEHMNFKSSKKLKAGEFDATIKKLGGVSNASTGFDYTHYYVKCAKNHTDTVLGLFAELLNNLTLKEDEFQSEREVVLEERLWRTDNSPVGYIHFHLYNQAFLHHPYHWTPIGFMDDIKSWTLKDLETFHGNFYRPEKAIVLLSGDVDAKSSIQQVAKHFEDISGKILDNWYYPGSFNEPRQRGPRYSEITDFKSDIDLVALSFKIPPYDHPDFFTLEALATLISDGKSSILHKVLVESGLCSDFYAYAQEASHESLFTFILLCNKGAKEALEALEDCIYSLKDKISDKDVKRSKNASLLDFYAQTSTASSLASLFGSQAIRGNIDPVLNHAKNIENLSLNALLDAASKYFDPNTKNQLILRRSA